MEFVKMENKNKQIYEDMHRYEHALLLGRLLTSEDKISMSYIAGAFQAMGKRFGVKEGDLEGLINGVISNAQSVAIAVKTYLEKYVVHV